MTAPCANVVAHVLYAGQPADAVAVHTLERTHSYAELRAATASVARALAGAGVVKGDRVLLIADNSFFWAASLFGILRLGAVVVPIAPSAPTADVAAMVAQARPGAAIFDASRAARVVPALGAVPSFTEKPAAAAPDAVALTLGDAHGGDAEPPVDVDAVEDLAMLMFTSGSTGQPKGVMLTHANVTSNTDAIVEYLALDANDRMMVVLPFCYCYGTSLLYTHLRAGGAVVLDHRFMFPDKVLARMNESGCTGFAGVPSHYQLLLRRSSMPQMRFPTLKRALQAGGKLADPLIDELASTIAPAEVFVMYGQTEATARLSYLPPSRLDDKRGSIGRGLSNVTLRIVDEAMNEVPVGVVGEIVAKGPSIAKGYWQDHEGTRATFVDGWLKTGDLAKRDEDGFIYIVDRAKNFLKAAGVRVSCVKVEEMLLGMTELVEAAVVAVPDPLSGEAVVAFVVGKDASDEPGLRARFLTYCKQKLPSELVPQSVRIVRELPKGANGKLLRPKLRELLADDGANETVKEAI